MGQVNKIPDWIDRPRSQTSVGEIYADGGSFWRAKTVNNVRPVEGEHWMRVSTNGISYNYIETVMTPVDIVDSASVGWRGPGLEIAPAPEDDEFYVPIALEVIPTTGDGYLGGAGYAALFYGDHDTNVEVFGFTQRYLGIDDPPDATYHQQDETAINEHVVDIVGRRIVITTNMNPGGGTCSLVIRFYYQLRKVPSATPFFLINGLNQATKTVTVKGDASSLAGSVAIVGASTELYDSITGVNQGTKMFTIAGDRSADYLPGATFAVVGSTGNDGSYTVVSAVFSVDHTDVVIVEVIPDSTPDGSITGGLSNDRTYTVVSATFDTDHTDIVVVEPIPTDYTVDGWVKQTS